MCLGVALVWGGEAFLQRNLRARSAPPWSHELEVQLLRAEVGAPPGSICLLCSSVSESGVPDFLAGSQG